jgi:hypothetical protein
VDTQTANLSSQVSLTGEVLRFEVAKLRLYRALGREIFPGVEASEAGIPKGSQQAHRPSGAGVGTP